MSTEKNLVAIGRSRYLYDGIKHLVSRGFAFKAIITGEAYDEYDIKSQDFEDLATTIGATFFMTSTLHSDSIYKLIKDNNIRIAISANWKFTIPQSFLDLFEGGILNFHLGNLPDYKGNATVNWSIINGEEYIYANIHKMDAALDAGDVIIRKAIPITAETYIAEIIAEAERTAPQLYEEAVNTVTKNSQAYKVKGTTRGLRCYPRLPEDSQINWNMNAESISRLVRASSHPYRGAFTFLNGEKITIWKASPIKLEDSIFAIPGHVVELNRSTGSISVACSDGLLEIQEIGYNGEIIPPATLIKSIRVRFKHLVDD